MGLFALGTCITVPHKLHWCLVNCGSIDFISSDQIDNQNTFFVATLNAKEAAGFIVKKYSAVAIGGFSGRDRIFSVETFNEFVKKGNVTYFVLTGPNLRPFNVSNNMYRPNITPIDNNPNQQILDHIIDNWEDVSIEADMPVGTIYKYN